MCVQTSLHPAIPLSTHSNIPLSPSPSPSNNTTVANKTKTSNPTNPAPNNPVLYVDDYGIHTGAHIYRATFPSTSTSTSTNTSTNTTSPPPTGVYIHAIGGLAFGYSAWLNSHFIGSWLGLSYVDEQGITLSFGNATLHEGEENVLVVVMDNSGHDQRTEALNPRGITNATLVGPSGDEKYAFSEWKIAGAAGVGSGGVDPVRGILNEGGFYAERVGLHLPGYPGTEFQAVPVSSTSNSSDDDDDNTSLLQVEGAGVRVFRTIVPLAVPEGLDVSISFRLSAPSSSSSSSSSARRKTNQLRALLFVNGYQYGRFNPYIGNQVDFPVPPGVLNYGGDNTVVVHVWSQSGEGAEVGVGWNVEFVHDTSYDMGFDSAYLRPGWDEGRLVWA